eukprot:2161638-Amphidinium_carterae.1
MPSAAQAPPSNNCLIDSLFGPSKTIGSSGTKERNWVSREQVVPFKQKPFWEQLICLMQDIME